MEFRVASAGRGLVWFRGGVRMLDRNPRGLLTVAALLILLQQIPGLLGPTTLAAVFAVTFLLLFPALFAGLQFAIAEADAGRPVGPGHLFEGLRRPGARASLIVLGLVVLLVVMAMAWIVHRQLSADQMQTLLLISQQKLKPDSPEFQAIAPALLKLIGTLLALGFVLTVGLFFAVPRVMFDARAALPALVESFLACASNVLPLLLYGVVFVAATFAAMLGLGVVAMFLGLMGSVGMVLMQLVVFALFVVTALVNAAVGYLAWREVFGHAQACAPRAGPPQGTISV